MADDTPEDPFAIFGEDDDDDDDQLPVVADNETARIAKSLVEMANQRASEKKVAVSGITEPRESENIKEVSLPGTILTDLWTDHPPLYVGPMKVVSSVSEYGGGRACVAAHDLEPGTLVLLEEPRVTWDSLEFVDDLGENSFPLLACLAYILQLPNAESILHDMEDFHPTKTDVDQSEIEGKESEQVTGMMNSLKAKYVESEEFQDCEHRSVGLKNRDGSAVQQKDLLRLLTALRYNALQSGLFLFSAMLNHEDSPNCVKFKPLEHTYSEVRTTRSVSVGEVLTISYLPNLVSHASRRSYLWEQHRFDIGVDMPSWLLEMEKIGKQLPPSNPRISHDEDSPTLRVEHAISELRQHCTDLFPMLAGFVTGEAMERAKALEQAVLELCTSAEQALRNRKHLLLIPCRRLHADACDLVLQATASRKSPEILLKRSQRVDLLARQVVSVRHLVELQNQFFGSSHFDLAQTHQDLHHAVSEMLALAPKRLLSLTSDVTNVGAWSSIERRSRQAFERIKALYPYDAESYLPKLTPKG